MPHLYLYPSFLGGFAHYLLFELVQINKYSCDNLLFVSVVSDSSCVQLPGLNVYVWLRNRLCLDLEMNIGFLKGIEFD